MLLGFRKILAGSVIGIVMLLTGIAGGAPAHAGGPPKPAPKPLAVDENDLKKALEFARKIGLSLDILHIFDECDAICRSNRDNITGHYAREAINGAIPVPHGSSRDTSAPPREKPATPIERLGKEYENPWVKGDPRRPILLNIYIDHAARMRDFADLQDFTRYIEMTSVEAIVDEEVKEGFPSNLDGTLMRVGIDFSVEKVIELDETFINRLFTMTGNLFSSCSRPVASVPSIYCKFIKPVPAGSLWSPGAPKHLTVLEKIPVCSDVIIDAGPGMELRINPNTISDTICDGWWRPVRGVPARFEIEQRYADTIKYGFPDIDSRTGDIVYTAPEVAEDIYIPMKVWIIGPDGTSSTPFVVTIHNRHRPQVVDPGTIEAITGVDTVVSPEQLFTDKDIDLYYSETEDQLTSSVVTNAEHGFAWFDAAGKFHYQSAPMEGKFVDHVTVKTVDRFGLPSQELTLTIQVGDVIPTCQTGGTSTDSHTPVRIELFCSLTPPDGWRQLKGIDISIVRPPQFGTITNLDPVSGSLTYTPDPAHPGPVTFDFQADNNGATRTTQHTIDVYGIPEPEPTPPPTP